jgi:hypothetical protein
VLIQFGHNIKNTKEDKELTDVRKILKEEDENEKLYIKNQEKEYESSKEKSTLWNRFHKI